MYQSFESIKSEILSRAKEKEACYEQYERASNSENLQGLLDVVKDNFEWCWDRKIIDIEILEGFGDELLWANRIYTKGDHKIELRGDEKATVRTLANSSATVETWENSSATVRTRANSSATVETRENSSATVRTRANSSATVRTLENSSATVRTWANSSATVETWANSSATVRTRANSSATVRTRANSIVRDFTKKKVYVYKDNWEIIQYEAQP